MYLLSSECNFSAMLTRREASSPRRWPRCTCLPPSQHCCGVRQVQLWGDVDLTRGTWAEVARGGRPETPLKSSESKSGLGRGGLEFKLHEEESKCTYFPPSVTSAQC